MALLILFLLTACGMPDSGSKQAKRVLFSEAKNADIISKQYLRCPEGDCPTGVGRLLIFQKEIVTCTVFLVRPDLALTNAHCIDSQKTCEKSKLFFRTGHGDKTAFYGCKKLLRRGRMSNDYNERNDYAFIQLDRKANVTPLKLDPDEGIHDGRTYKVWTMNTLDEFGSILQSRECRASRSLRLPQYRNSWSQYAYFDGCNIIPGNSGSPVANASGEIVGLIFARMEYQRDGQRTVGGLAYNLACVIFPRLAEFTGSSCTH